MDGNGERGTGSGERGAGMGGMRGVTKGQYYVQADARVVFHWIKDTIKNN